MNDSFNAMIIAAFLLAMASSTDNFAVGLGVGLAQKPLLAKTNVIISVCNALGAWVASVFGNGWTDQGCWLSILASLAFFYLAYQEIRNEEGDDDDAPSNNKSTAVSPIMAIPMTLNNLVGGVAGGVVGISPAMAAICALIASYLTMAVGHWMGKSASNHTAALYQPSRLAAGIYAILGIVSLWGIVT